MLINVHQWIRSNRPFTLSFVELDLLINSIMIILTFFASQTEAEQALTHEQYSDCKCESMCPCPSYLIKEVRLAKLSEPQQKLLHDKGLLQ